jgi:hypothetical protein
MASTRATFDSSKADSLPAWEDLLVRFEIMPRVLRVTLEEAGGTGGAAAEILRRLIAGEDELSAWIREASAAGGDAGGAAPAAAGDVQELADRFASLRARNFAMLQRRGVEVWEWSAPLATGERTTALQMVSDRVGSDAEALRALRNGVQLGVAGC